MNLDIHTGVLTAFLLALTGVIFSLLLGIRSIRSGARLMFFRKRRDLMVRGWRLIFVSVILGAVAFSLNRYAEPVAYMVFPPSPTITSTPTITLTPTITQTATITLTPSITPTPAISYTPAMPPEIEVQFTSVVTPSGNTVFSPLQFARKMDENLLPIEPSDTFDNPITTLYGTFSFDKMDTGSQWTALWYRLDDDKIVCYETAPWTYGTGGYGYTECTPSSDQWIPGQYEVRIFVGSAWNSSGRFLITGEPPAPSITPTPSRTATATRTATGTRTATATPGPTLTRTPTLSPTITLTRTPSRTPTITRTLPPTSTQYPTRTPRATDTKWPTQTPAPQ